MKRRFGLLRVAIVLAWSVLVWTALWFELSAANVFWGAVVGALTLVLVPLPGGRQPVPVRPLAALRFAGSCLWALVRASAVVAWEVVTPRNRIHQGIVAAPLRTRSAGIITLIANVISLTPGALTIEVREDPPTLYVHIMHLRTIEQVRGDIARLEEGALRAFPVADAVEFEEPG